MTVLMSAQTVIGGHLVAVDVRDVVVDDSMVANDVLRAIIQTQIRQADSIGKR